MFTEHRQSFLNKLYNNFTLSVNLLYLQAIVSVLLKLKYNLKQN